MSVVCDAPNTKHRTITLITDTAKEVMSFVAQGVARKKRVPRLR